MIWGTQVVTSIGGRISPSGSRCEWLPCVHPASVFAVGRHEWPWISFGDFFPSFFSFIAVQLIYDVVIISAVQQSRWVMQVHSIHSFPGSFPCRRSQNIGESSFPVPCSRSPGPVIPYSTIAHASLTWGIFAQWFSLIQNGMISSPWFLGKAPTIGAISYCKLFFLIHYFRSRVFRFTEKWRGK